MPRPPSLKMMMELPLSQLRKLTPPSHYFRVSNWRRPTHSLSPDLFCREWNWGPACRVLGPGIITDTDLNLPGNCLLTLKVTAVRPFVIKERIHQSVSVLSLKTDADWWTGHRRCKTYFMKGHDTTLNFHNPRQTHNSVQRVKWKGNVWSTTHSPPSIFRASIVGNDWPHSDFLEHIS